MRRRFPKGVIAIIAIVTVLAVAITVGVFKLLNRATPLTGPSEGCRVVTPEGSRDLDIEQARISSIIAAVAARRKLPERAAVIAYATGIQESKLFNVNYGDRDSLGVFQQRPSQGWGTPKQLLDPVYATEKFFAELVKVKDYRKLPLHEAAQLVQRSADGNAYAQHETDGKILAAAFTGRVAGAVHCWFSPPESASPSATATGAATGEPAANRASPTGADRAARRLARVLGGGTTGDTVLDAASRRRGWLVAAWSMAHAQEYGLRRIRYDGRAWTAEHGHDGWQPDTAAPSARVEIS